MEMHNASRNGSFDRSSRDPATLKKPRLLTEEPTILRNSSSNNNHSNPNRNSRPLIQRQPLVGLRESDSTKGGGYQPQSLSQMQQQQHQELISQYRTALAELTFNSKPIITNLTIIAGENLHAARAIAATICNNILEVPSDQKLPSLYLLDSIVKNIGRDYIKHFAARLPEVFCKAYRQVDSAIHSGMRHLFGTWKGVFPPQMLQMIEKELEFQSAENGSSGLTTSRSELQPQRPGRSIHVNPKYLEARQNLQQSSRAKGTTSNITSNLVNSSEDTERPDRTAANVNSGRPRVDPRLKMHNIQQAQRNAGSGLTHENNSAAVGDFDYGSDILSPSETSFGKPSERVAEQGYDNSWYGPRSNSTETISSQRNGLDIKRGFPNLSTPSSAIADGKLQAMNNLTSKRGSEVNRSWKNSEEEEYMWDDINSGSVIPGTSSSSRKDPRLQFESERLGIDNHLQKPQRMYDLGSRLEREASSDLPPTEQKDQPAFRQLMTSLRSQGLSLTDGDSYLGSGGKSLDNAEGFSTSFSGGSTTVNPLPRASLQSVTGSSHIRSQVLGVAPNAIPEPHRRTVGAAIPSAQAPAHQRPPSPSFSHYQAKSVLSDLAEQDRPHMLPDADGKAVRSRGQTNMGLPSYSPQDSFQMMPQNSHLGNTRNAQLHNLQPPSPGSTMLHPKTHAPFLQPLPPESISESSAQSPKLLPQNSAAANPLTSSSSAHPKSLVADTLGPSRTSSLLAAVSNIFGNKSVAGSIPESSYQSELNLPPPLSSGLLPPQFTSSGSGVMSSLVSPSSHESMSLSASFLQSKTNKLPLPSGPPPLDGTAMSTPSSSVVNATSDPVSSLLSTLVAKGLISASKADSPSSFPTSVKSQSLQGDATTSQAVPQIVVSSVLSTSSTYSELSIPKPATSTFTIPQSTKEDIRSLIGFNFKPHVIRESHPAVISELTDDLPHQCTICGLRFKLRERFDRHMEWHALRNSESNAPNKASRRWFSNSDDWVCGKPDIRLCDEATDLIDCTEEALVIDGEQMVTADESQCVCVLCGELFDDFYSPEKHKWLFKGAVYLGIIDHKGGNIGNDAVRGPVVHANCISEHSCSDLGLAKVVKLEGV